MFKLTIRSIWDHKRRLIGTVLATVLGVAFMSGTFVLSDTLRRVFDDLFAEGFEEVDAQVRGTELFSSQQGGEERSDVPQELLETVAAVDGVDIAVPYVITFGFGSQNRVLDEKGDPIGAAFGPPTLIESWYDDERVSPYVVKDGRGPTADDEIALNVAAADEGELEIGDKVRLLSSIGPKEYTLVGLVTFGTADSSAGAVSAEFTLAEAQRIAGMEGKLNQINAKAVDGVSQEDLAARIAPVLPAETQVVTGKVAAAELSEDVTAGFQFFTIVLQVFGLIALIVGTFIIANTFAILIAQRTRELALLRAIGASRRQVLISVLLEAVVIGIVAAILGLVAGIGLATGVTALLDALGVDLPSAGIVVGSRTIIAAFVIGLIVTVAAAIAPAIRATRVPPLAALRSVSIDRSGTSKVRLGFGVLFLLLAVLNLSRAWTADGDTDAIPSVGFGALMALVGAITVGPLLAGPTTRVLGSWLPRWRGITGRLATGNAARNPKRTSATASALLIGVALVGFITVFAASAKASVTDEVTRGIRADLIVQPQIGFGGFSGMPVTVAEDMKAVDGVEKVTAFGFSNGQAVYPDGKDAVNFVGSVEPELVEGLLEPRMAEGDISDLTDDGVVIDQGIAEDHDMAIGDQMALTLAGGTKLDLTVRAISDDTVVLGFWTITRATMNASVPEPSDGQVFLQLADGADIEAVRADAEDAVAEIPSVTVQDLDEFAGSIAAQLTALVNFIYGLLALSIIIAMIGIANTLSLSIYERTRELGLLRSVGTTQAQIRSTVRWEAVLISVLGSLVGLGLGLALSYVMVVALEGYGLTTFRVPGVTLIIWVVLLAGLGVIASLLPARRAARLDILRAIGAE
jgi:putative ABC transport system permease protein